MTSEVDALDIANKVGHRQLRLSPSFTVLTAACAPRRSASSKLVIFVVHFPSLSGFSLCHESLPDHRPPFASLCCMKRAAAERSDQAEHIILHIFAQSGFARLAVFPHCFLVSSASTERQLDGARTLVALVAHPLPQFGLHLCVSLCQRLLLLLPRRECRWICRSPFASVALARWRTRTARGRRCLTGCRLEVHRLSVSYHGCR